MQNDHKKLLLSVPVSSKSHLTEKDWFSYKLILRIRYTNYSVEKEQRIKSSTNGNTIC